MPELVRTDAGASSPPSEFGRWCSTYRNSGPDNERIFASFTRLTDSLSWLKRHRDWVEAHRFGYGQRAFHYSWWLLVLDLAASNRAVSMLELGVFKGQTLSLVALCATQLGITPHIVGVSPFRGNRPSSPWSVGARLAWDAAFRREYRLGNLHPDGDHLADVARIFAEFGLDFGRVTAVRGLSTAPEVIARVRQDRFNLVFIDGDHSYEVARSDIANYAPLVQPGGYLVVDDAARFLPGRGYFKGMKEVSRACLELENMPEFSNVLNVGHNRVFRRVAAGSAATR